ncbi:MAG: chloride channel protein [Acidobacteria bacterium]|nr:chloride channel protein [Acidobacteriota bacterium]
MKLARLRTTLRSWTERFQNREDQLAMLLSLIIGVLVGLVIVAFILLTGRLAARMYPAGGAAWRRVLIPTAGALVTGWLLFKYFPNARGSGIPQTKFAFFINDGYIALRTVLGKFFCCSASLASGIALGREGPSVQIGGGIASVLGRRFGLSPENVKNLVPVGCAAALAAAFNTPIAAVLFSLEEILGDLHAPVLGSVVISSATSWMMLHLILGDEPLFHVPAYQLVHPLELGIYAVLGVVGGLGSVCFVKLLLKIRTWFRRFPKSTVWLQPAAGGLLVGMMGWFIPEVLGVGYDYVDRVLGGDFPLRIVVLLAVLKIVATAMCYSSGNAGGIFGPSLFIGAMLGGSLGGVAHNLLPTVTATPGAYALVGMGTAFAGIVRTPFTSVIMIFELTRDYSIIVPLMVSNLISYFVSYRLQREPIYEALALQDGVYLPTGESRAELAGIRVSEVMKSEAQLLPADMVAAAAKRRLEEMGRNAWPAGTSGRLFGIVTARQLEGRKDAATARLRDIIDSGAVFPYVHPDHPLSLALERMGAAGVDAVPVVSRANIRRVLAVVTLTDVLAAYGVVHRTTVKA